jgi:hypothetical protein
MVDSIILDARSEIFKTTIGALRENKECRCTIIHCTTRKKERGKSYIFYDFVVDENGKLVSLFWADATSRKNYIHFGDLVSFDATYSTNQ